MAASVKLIIGVKNVEKYFTVIMISFCGYTAKGKKVKMRNPATPFACSICKKEFHSLILLEKHVELRHQTEIQSFGSTKTNISIGNFFRVLNKNHFPNSDLKEK